MHDGTIGVPQGPEEGQEAMDVRWGEEVHSGIVCFGCPGGNGACGNSGVGDREGGLDVADDFYGFGEERMVFFLYGGVSTGDGRFIVFRYYILFPS